jgi:hypothetical protein
MSKFLDFFQTLTENRNKIHRRIEDMFRKKGAAGKRFVEMAK